MQLLIVNAASDVKTVNDLISGRRRNRASSITRRHDHDQAHWLSVQQIGRDRDRAVPNGSAEAAQGLLTKSVDFSSTAVRLAVAHQGGQFRVLAVRPVRSRPCRSSLITTAVPNMDDHGVARLVAPKARRRL